MEEMKSVAEALRLEVRPKTKNSLTAHDKCRHSWRLITAVTLMTVFNVGAGGIEAYPSPAIPDLNAHGNPFHVTDDEWSWIAALITLGISVGSPVIGTASDLLGRKLAMMTSALLIVGSLTVVTAATETYPVYAGVFLMGFFMTINSNASLLYVAEISPVKVRAVCTSITLVSYSMGMVLINAMGAVLPWNWLTIVLASCFAIPTVIVAFLPESPYWFGLRGNREAAVHGMQWYQGRCDEEQMQAIDRCLHERSFKSGWSSWKDLVAVEEQRTSLFICIVTNVLKGISGIYPLQAFMVNIFQLTGSTTLGPNLQATVSSLFNVFGGITCPLIIDRVERRTLLIASTATMSFAMAITGIFFRLLATDPGYTQQRLFWLPLVSLSLCSFAFSAGLLPVPYIFTCEMFPMNTRGNAQAVTSVAVGLASFTSTKTFITLQALVGTSSVFFVYAGICAAAASFVMFAVKKYKPGALR